MAASKIEWTERTWNPVVGCSVLSPGCTNCYAMKMAGRLEAMASRPDGTGNHNLDHYAGTTRTSRSGYVWTGKVNAAPDSILTAPLRRRKPTVYFVNSMADLFHEAVPDEVIDRVFAVMALCPQHTFQCLTKRSARMREYFSIVPGRTSDRVQPVMSAMEGLGGDGEPIWPLPNVMLGVSVEDQQRADQRIPDLLATPAAVRFLSCEPLLGPVDLEYIKLPEPVGDYISLNALTGLGYRPEDDDGNLGADPCEFENIDWVIAGSESGPRARPCDVDWVRALRDQCDASGTAFFWKQHIVGRQKIGTPELDGRTWIEFPKSAPNRAAVDQARYAGKARDD